MTDKHMRSIMQYDFEGGGSILVSITGNVDIEYAMDMLEEIIKLKRQELARIKERAGNEAGG